MNSRLGGRHAIEQMIRRATPSRLVAAPRSESDVRVRLTMPAWTVHRSTDRIYIYERFARLAHDYRLQFYAADQWQYVAAWNARYLARRGLGLFGLNADATVLTPRLWGAAPADVVFSYGCFPKDIDDTPVLWEHTFAPQLGANGDDWIQHWRAVGTAVADRATQVVTATTVSADWFIRAFPRNAAKIHVVPYYMPHLAPIDEACLDAKVADNGRVRCVFVGKEARRKGLPVLVEAWQKLDLATRSTLDVKVVSAMIDGAVAIPDEWEQCDHVPDVQAVMRAAHVLVFPSRLEAFGLVLVEAMASGCLPLTTSAPIQRSIVGPEAGVFVDPSDASALASALTLLVRDRGRLEHGMRASRLRFIQEYHPDHVGQRYSELLFRTAGHELRALRRSTVEQHIGQEG